MPAFVKTGIHLSDTHRPGRYAINDDPYYESQEFKAGYIRSERQVVGGMPIDYVGTCVFTAVEDEKFYIFTHPESQMVAGMQRQQGIEAVVLGCTELPLLFQGVSLPLACLDTMQIHIDSLVRYILEEETL